MPNRSRRSRAGAARLRGRHRADELAKRLGIGLQEARLAIAARQGDVAADAGVSQSWVSRMEAGRGQSASLETWAAVAAATGSQLVSFLEEQPGATRPRDYEHLKRQQLVATAAAPGGWQPTPERLVDPAWRRPRSVDVFLERPARREFAVVEIVDLFADVGDVLRALDAKVATVARDLAARELAGAAPGRVGGLLVVRGTRRNRALVREFRALFEARFGRRSSAWLTALRNPSHALPEGHGLAWTDAGATRLIPARL